MGFEDDKCGTCGLFPVPGAKVVPPRTRPGRCLCRSCGRMAGDCIHREEETDEVYCNCARSHRDVLHCVDCRGAMIAFANLGDDDNSVPYEENMICVCPGSEVTYVEAVGEPTFLPRAYFECAGHCIPGPRHTEDDLFWSGGGPKKYAWRCMACITRDNLVRGRRLRDARYKDEERRYSGTRE